MAFVGEVEHLAGDFEELKGVEELEAFAHVEAVVELSVDDERGGCLLYTSDAADE